ncbi:MAG TPA: response regulator [Candidatus Sulfotelmatobacter sp.]|nr:response regulator [Candidatus Sulfotelmatobacter sp.]
MAKLVIISKNTAAASLALGDFWATIGRSHGNTFQILESSVSGRHCEVRLQGDELILRDLASTNGTFAGGEKVTETKLQYGQTFRLGEVELRFEQGGVAESGTVFLSKMLVTNTAGAVQKISPPVPPPEKAAPEKKLPPENPEVVAKKHNVLFVDDSMAFLDLFSSVCAEHSRHTWEIFTATGADGALEILREKKIHLATLDIGMPTLDGLQLLGIIKGRYPGLKIAIITGKATEARRATALANGADLFLEKPLTADSLAAMFNILNDLVSWRPPQETVMLKKDPAAN